MSLSVPTPTVHISNHKFGPFSKAHHTIIESHGIKKLGFSRPTLNRFPSGLNLRNAVRGENAVCRASAAFSPQNLQWISAVSSVILLFGKATSIHKAFLVPYFALQAPINVISWIKNEHGTWAAFLALLLRLFYFIPGELELPLHSLLLLIVAPYQAYDLRGTPAGTIISLVIAGYLACQHFSRVGSLRRVFDQGSFISTLALIFIVSVPCIFLF